jgi:hypothetical protein
MAKNGYRWMLAAVAAAGMSGAALADGDGGDSSMNPFYGESWAPLEGHGHNLGQPDIAPSGAFVAHEMDGQSGTPLAERMRQAEAKAAAFAEKVRQQTRDAMHLSPSNPSNSNPSNSDSGTTGPDTSVRISPANPKGSGPTIVGPTPSAAPTRMPANTFEDNTGG